MKPVRHGIYGIINNQVELNAVTIPVYDEKVFTDQSPPLYILLSTQQETLGPDQNDCSEFIRSSIDIEIIRRSGSEVSKDDIDDVSDQLYELIIPSLGEAGFTLANFRISYAARDSAFSQNISITETESVLRKIIRFVFNLNA